MPGRFIACAKAGTLAFVLSLTLSVAGALAASGGGGGGGGSSGGGGGASGAGGGGGGGGGGSASGLTCNAGWMPEPGGQYCVRCPEAGCPETDAKLDDADLYVTGRELALAGHYEDALGILGAVVDKDAMTLTMIGYATRKLGHTEEGIAIYHQALALDPDNLNTHEYLGEGYLAAGRIDLAELQLDVLQRLCGVDCEQYQDLNKAILGEPVWN
jgi:tetratricopeptide (TPR) repeat protein